MIRINYDIIYIIFYLKHYRIYFDNNIGNTSNHEQVFVLNKNSFRVIFLNKRKIGFRLNLRLT